MGQGRDSAGAGATWGLLVSGERPRLPPCHPTPHPRGLTWTPAGPAAGHRRQVPVFVLEYYLDTLWKGTLLFIVCILLISFGLVSEV